MHTQQSSLKTLETCRNYAPYGNDRTNKGNGASQVGGRHVLRLWIGNGGNPNSLLEDFTDTWEEFT